MGQYYLKTVRLQGIPWQSSVVRMPHFTAGGLSLIPGLGLRSHKSHGIAKKRDGKIIDNLHFFSCVFFSTFQIVYSKHAFLL